MARGSQDCALFTWAQPQSYEEPYFRAAERFRHISLLYCELSTGRQAESTALCQAVRLQEQQCDAGAHPLKAASLPPPVREVDGDEKGAAAAFMPGDATPARAAATPGGTGAFAGDAVGSGLTGVEGPWLPLPSCKLQQMGASAEQSRRPCM